MQNSTASFYVKYRGQIEVISAQLAAQQTKLIQLERVGGIDGEKMLSERIVEKQLRIKQARTSPLYYTCIYIMC